MATKPNSIERQNSGVNSKFQIALAIFQIRMAFLLTLMYVSETETETDISYAVSRDNSPSALAVKNRSTPANRSEVSPQSILGLFRRDNINCHSVVGVTVCASGLPSEGNSRDCRVYIPNGSSGPLIHYRGAAEFRTSIVATVRLCS